MMDLVTVLFSVITVVAIVITLFGLHDIDVRLARMECSREQQSTHVSQLPTIKTEAVFHSAQPRQLKWRQRA